MYNILKYKIIIILFTILYLGSCTVNETTSKITINNKSDIWVSNIKIGNTIICSLIGPGNSYEYYFTNELSGSLSGNDVIPARYTNQYSRNKYTAVEKSDGTFTLSPAGYYFDCDIFIRDDKYYIALGVDNKNGYNYNEDDIDEYIIEDFYED